MQIHRPTVPTAAERSARPSRPVVGSELGSCGALVASPHTQACSAGVLHGRRSERAPRPPGFSIWFMIQSDDLTCNTHSMICNDLCKRLYNTRKLLVFTG